MTLNDPERPLHTTLRYIAISGTRCVKVNRPVPSVAERQPGICSFSNVQTIHKLAR